MLTKHLVKAIKNRKSILTQDAEIDWDDIYTQDGPNYYEAITQVARRANNPRATREFIRAQLEPIFSAHQVPFDLQGFEKAYTEFNQAKMSKNIFDKKTKDSDIKNIKSVPYKGFIIDVYEDLTVYYGDKYFARNNTGEPYLQTKKFRTPEMAIAWEKNNIDAHTNDSKTKDASIPDMHQKRILIDTIKNPSKGMFLGGPSFAEAKEILMKKFGYTEQQIKNLSRDSKTKDKYGDKIAYKGYLIGEYLNGKFWIEKDGFVIRHEAPSIEDAKKDINMLTADSKTKDFDPRGYKVTDQIIKGFMIYKSGKPNIFTAKNESGEQYEGTMEEIKAKIDAYWVKRDEDVMKQKVHDAITVGNGHFAIYSSVTGEIFILGLQTAEKAKQMIQSMKSKNPELKKAKLVFGSTAPYTEDTTTKEINVNGEVVKQKVNDAKGDVSFYKEFSITENGMGDFLAQLPPEKSKFYAGKPYFVGRSMIEVKGLIDQFASKNKQNDSKTKDAKSYRIGEKFPFVFNGKRMEGRIIDIDDNSAKGTMIYHVLSPDNSDKSYIVEVDAISYQQKYIRPFHSWGQSSDGINPLKKGDIVRFKSIVDPGDKKVRMILLENPDGGRVRVASMPPLVPSQHIYLVSELVKDSKTKDGIKYPHPRFRIKDDKLFKLKSAVKKMKDAAIERMQELSDSNIVNLIRQFQKAKISTNQSKEFRELLAEASRRGLNTWKIGDSKTKDKSPRFRIKDDKLFRLKSMVKKMKDGAIRPEIRKKLETLFYSIPYDKNYTAWYSRFMPKARSTGATAEEIQEFLSDSSMSNDSKTKDKVFFPSAIVKQDGKKKNISKPVNAESPEEAKKSLEKFILANVPAVEIISITCDSKMKDSIKYPHPRFRIKDDKLFILKNAVKKMK